MADDYSKLRNLNKRLDGLGAQEDEAIAAVKARYAEKRKRLRAERTELLTAVKGEEEKPEVITGPGPLLIPQA